MIIFGQGAMRCHPYIFAELSAAKDKDQQAGLIAFDRALMGHFAYTMSNFVRSLLLGLTNGRITRVSGGKKTRRYFQQITCWSAHLL